ncbi:hypothetical protein SLA2020_212780 [Shorea laevis]
MAPTAAMLILSHHNKPSSTSSPPLVSVAAASIEMKASANKMVLQKRSGVDSKEPTMEAADSALEKRFREALELSCW